MTGTRISNSLWRVFPLLGIGLAAAAADHLTLAGGEARLSGNVVSINESGVVELTTELSPEPLLLRDGVVEKIEFSARGKPSDPPATLIGLANGDLLPATIERLDSHHLSVVSPDAGRLDIPRETVRSIQTGIRRRKVVFEGPNNLDEWTTTDEGRKNLSFENGIISANGPTSFSTKLPLPRQFILRFELIWQERQTPNFQVYFADPLLARGEPGDRYYLQFGGAGLEIKREASRGKRFNTIVILNRTRDQFPDNRMRIELRVNRDTARLELLIDGESEGEFADPIAGIPDGSGIVFVSNTSNGVRQQFRGIEVLEFDDSRSRHRAEDRGDPARDSLISREDDRWSGELTEILPTPKGLVFVFKTDFQDAPMEIPESDVSTVFLAGGKNTDAKQAPHPFVIRLPGEGSLRVSSCRIGGEKITASHPLLGPLAIRREGIASIERTPHPAEPTPEP
ncbi:MAG: hypothetical protein MUF86_03320 [Akkermansiaceae bacterium]|nr:hypothetical protein [Akkermansiaceae bacterium]